MLDVAIVGGGLTGLIAAREFEAAGVDYALFEARDRFGGRILTRRCSDSGIEIDLGPSWYWPDRQPSIAKEVGEMGLESFPQLDDGTVWLLTDPDKPPHKLVQEALHMGARRIVGGIGRVVEKLVSALARTRLHTGWILSSVHEKGPFVRMSFDTGDGEAEIRARRVVLAMPPRLIEEHILFAPELPGGLQGALRAHPTWMAAQAKAVAVYAGSPNFREDVGSGNAFVRHEHAVLREVFDSSDLMGAVPALGGFLAMTHSQRAPFRDGMGMLVTSQFVQLFGPAYEKGATEYQDWAAEHFTCSSQDRREETLSHHPEPADPCLREPLWRGKLRFAGSEFSARECGYLEGAVVEGERVASEITAAIREGKCSSKVGTK